MKKAFTLIELLVVVLIIGILSAVALPQYKRAVDKARLTELLIQGRTLLEAQQLYVTANGELARDLSALDIDIPSSAWTCKSSCASVSVAGVSFEISAYISVAHLSYWCKAANADDAHAKQLCVSLGGTYSHASTTTSYYLIHQK